MKKFLVFILAVLYIGSSTGATIHMHYCMGKLVNLGLNSESKKCPKCPSKEKSSSCSKECCKDLHKTVKLEKDQKLAEIGLKLIDAPSYTLSSFNIPEHTSPALSSIPNAHPYIKGPPARLIVQSYILYCNFRVWFFPLWRRAFSEMHTTDYSALSLGFYLLLLSLII